MSTDAATAMCCGIIHGPTPMVEDANGCILVFDHDGPHEFVDADGKHWLWETDLECPCAHCERCEGDYCTTYWPKAYCETPTSS